MFIVTINGVDNLRSTNVRKALRVEKFSCELAYLLTKWSKIDPEFWVKYVHPGVRVNLTRFASVAY